MVEADLVAIKVGEGGVDVANVGLFPVGARKSHGLPPEAIACTEETVDREVGVSVIVGVELFAELGEDVAQASDAHAAVAQHLLLLLAFDDNVLHLVKGHKAVLAAMNREYRLARWADV